MISAVHDNRILGVLKNPVEVLKAAGLTQGHQVLEVGCGPGFYTLPASEIVGSEGKVFAIRRVEKKVTRAGAKNVIPMCLNAADSGLQDQSIDSAFLFGLPRVAGGQEPLIRELSRVLKPGGVVTIQKSRRSENVLIDQMQGAGFYCHSRQGRLLRFRRR
jgi:ubiquinone/menaquinone biosynthesis C-methylase UbiE